MKLLASIVFFIATGSVYAQQVPQTFGDRQLAQLLDDRPDMKGILPADDTICRWVVGRFNSGDFGHRVHWDHHEPLSGREAENQPSQEYSPAFIRITDSEGISGRDKWCMLVFEFENLENSPQFEKLYQLASAQQIIRAQFVLKCVQLELKAVQRAKRYFKRNPIIGSTIDNAPHYSAYITATSELATYIEWLDSREDEAYDPRDYFGEYYDRCKAYAEAYGPYGSRR